jgi:hypothetical protein
LVRELERAAELFDRRVASASKNYRPRPAAGGRHLRDGLTPGLTNLRRLSMFALPMKSAVTAGTFPAKGRNVCGLGSSVSAQDVLEGSMVVQVLVQMIHPAEFIELTFKQKMEAGG